MPAKHAENFRGNHSASLTRPPAKAVAMYSLCVQGVHGLRRRVLLANGGASGVHTHSAFLRDEKCFIAVGPFVCALELPTLQLLWHFRADAATCFGIYDAPAYASIISHGELEIASLTYSGQKIWASSATDIFTEEFKLDEHHAEAVDFHGIRYRFELKTGQIQIISVE